MAALEGHQADDPPYQRRARKRPKPGRPANTGPGYAERWKVERTFAWLGNFRRLLARHERYLSAFRALCLVAFIVISLRRISERLGTIVS
jgi:transposase